MGNSISTSDQTAEALKRRDEILSAITRAAERFLWASAATWPQTVQEVIAELGQSLKIRRIYLCKHQEVTADHVITGLRYEWVAVGVTPKMPQPELQHIHLQEAGFSRWCGILYDGGVIHELVAKLPPGERGSMIGDGAISIIVVPVYVGTQWWGFIGIEDYVTERRCSQGELDAFKTVAVTFGSAIRRKRAEEALNKEKQHVEEKAKEIEDVAKFPAEDPSPVLRLDQTGMVRYANRAAEPLLTLWQTTMGQAVPKEWQAIVERVFQDQKSEALDVVLESRVLSLLVVPVKQETYVNVYGRDVTRERELDQMKSDFISMVSHQLRTPLTSMRWYSERLLKKAVTLPEDQKDMARVIHHTSAQLAILIDDLLNLSRMERGTMVAEPVIANMLELINEVVVEQRGAADKKQINFTFKPDGDIPAFLFDKKLIREVLLNLASNALKYTPEQGQVTITAQLKENEVLVQVTDTGMGIAEADKGKIFEKFYRSPKAVDSGVEGTGLGLSVAKLMVEKSGGSIGFESTEGQGTTFFFRLPFKTEETKTEYTTDTH